MITILMYNIFNHYKIDNINYAPYIVVDCILCLLAEIAIVDYMIH